MNLKPDKESERDTVLAGVEPALRRSERRARETAAQTGTPLVIYQDGEIEKRMVTHEKEQEGISQ